MKAARIAGYAVAGSLDQPCRKILHIPLAEAQGAISQQEFVRLAVVLYPGSTAARRQAYFSTCKWIPELLKGVVSRGKR